MDWAYLNPEVGRQRRKKKSFLGLECSALMRFVPGEESVVAHVLAFMAIGRMAIPHTSRCEDPVQKNSQHRTCMAE